MALTTLTALKTHLGVPLSDTDDDDFFTQLLAAVEAAFLTLIDRRIEEAEYEEFYSTEGTQVVLLNEYPVSEVAEVRLDENGLWGQRPGSFGADTVREQGTDWALVQDGRNGVAEAGKLWRIDDVWPARWERPPGCLGRRPRPCPGCLKVSYTAGYATVPSEIPLAIWQICAEMRTRRRTGYPFLSERFEDYGYSQMVADAANLWQVGSPKQIVTRYRRTTPRHTVLT